MSLCVSFSFAFTSFSACPHLPSPAHEKKVILLLNPISLFGRPNFKRLLFSYFLFLVNQHQPTAAASTLLPLTNSNKKYLKAASVFTCLSFFHFIRELSVHSCATTCCCCKHWRHNFTSVSCVIIISFFFASSQTRIIIILCALGLSLSVCVCLLLFDHFYSLPWFPLSVYLSVCPLCLSVCQLTSKKAVLLP